MKDFISLLPLVVFLLLLAAIIQILSHQPYSLIKCNTYYGQTSLFTRRIRMNNEEFSPTTMEDRLLAKEVSSSQQ